MSSTVRGIGVKPFLYKPLKRIFNITFAHPISIALWIAAVFSLRFINCLPFSNNTRVFNSETVTTLISFFIYSKEPFSFPMGAIKNLTFPFVDANVGNVGAIPLFAITFKALGKFFPYFQTFDYFVLVEIISSFLTALITQSVLMVIGVTHIAFRILGALLIGASFILLTRSAMLQPFCVVAFPLFIAWIYLMLRILQGRKKIYRSDYFIVILFPLASLVDNYALVGILLGTFVLILREFYEAYLGGLSTSWNRFFRMFFLLLVGVSLSLLSLYVIGMFPLPAVPETFTSYNFGMGGRFHVADIFAPWIPVGNNLPEASLLSDLSFIPSTDGLGNGQYEGVAYVGSPVLFLWFCIAITWLFYRGKKFTNNMKPSFSTIHRVVLYSPWKKIGLAVLCVFIFSLGYELHIYGKSFPDFSGMPAAWIADRFPALYNIRAVGRLASLLSIFLILESIRIFYNWYIKNKLNFQNRTSIRWSPSYGLVIVGLFAVIHLIEISPLLRPVPVQPSYPIGSIYSEQEIIDLRRLGNLHDVVFISPSLRPFELRWMTEAFTLAYYLGLPSNLYLLARSHPEHEVRIANDLVRVNTGDWDTLVNEYGSVLFAVPTRGADEIRFKVPIGFEEIKIGPMSLWSKRDNLN